MSTLIPIEQWADEIGESPRWARDQVHNGSLLAVKVGRRYFLTPELIAAMSARAIPTAQQDSDSEGWGQITRSAS